MSATRATSPDAESADNPILAALATAYASARMVPGGYGAVAPLRRLVAGLGLVVDEVPNLSRTTAARHFAARSGAPILVAAADEELAGFLYANAAGGWILVKAEDPLVRRRFSIAHEIGHYLLHFLPALAEAESADEVEFHEALTIVADAEAAAASSQGSAAFSAEARSVPVSAADLARMEDEADRFAAALLLPAAVVTVLTARHGARSAGKRGVLARRLAADCLVSQAAMRRRLAELGLGGAEDWGDTR